MSDRKASPVEIIRDLIRYVKDVANGADPIEALHGHICSDKCWHKQSFQSAVQDHKKKKEK